MLPKEYRLRKDKDFQSVYWKGKVFQNNFFIVRILKNNQQVSRFGFVVSAKVSKKATERNRLKRRLRELIRLNLNKFETGFDVVIIAKKSALANKTDILKENLFSIFKISKFIHK